MPQGGTPKHDPYSQAQPVALSPPRSFVGLRHRRGRLPVGRSLVDAQARSRLAFDGLGGVVGKIWRGQIAPRLQVLVGSEI